MDIEMIKIHARQLVKLIGLEVTLTDSRQNTLETDTLRYVSKRAGDETSGYYVNDRFFDINQVGIVISNGKTGGIIALNYPVEREVAA